MARQKQKGESTMMDRDPFAQGELAARKHSSRSQPVSERQRRARALGSRPRESRGHKRGAGIRRKL